MNSLVRDSDDAGLHECRHHGVRSVRNDDRIVAADLSRVVGRRLDDQQRLVSPAAPSGDVAETALTVGFEV